MQIRVVFEWDEVTKSYAAYCPELPGVNGCGDTKQEALQDFRNGLELFFQQDEPLPKMAEVQQVII